MLFQAAAIVEAAAHRLIFTSEWARIAPAKAGVQFRAAAAQVAELFVAAAVAIAAGVAAAAARVATAGAVASAAGCTVAATFAAAGGRRGGCRSGFRCGRRRGAWCRWGLRRGGRHLRVVIVIAVLVRRRRNRALFYFCVGRGGNGAAGHGDENRPSRAVHVLDSNPLKGRGGEAWVRHAIPLVGLLFQAGWQEGEPP